jgi:glycosyltransferase involved in cell wall biosynthesis
MAEYAASGLAVLSTPFGCRGFELDGLHSVQIAELEGFAEELVRLVDQAAMDSPQKEGRADREVIAANHDWNDIADAYFAHLVSVYARTVYNRRQDSTGVCLE